MKLIYNRTNEDPHFYLTFFMLHELKKIIPLNFIYSKQYDTYQTVYSYHLVQCIIVNLYFSVIYYIFREWFDLQS